MLDEYAGNQERPVDVLFVGGFSRHHQRRAKLLEAVAACADKLNVVMHLDQSRLARFAASPLGRLLPLAQRRAVPAAVRRVSRPSVYGRDMYRRRCRGP